MDDKKITSVIRENAPVILYVFFLNILLLIPAVLAPIFKKVFTDYILTEGNHDWLPYFNAN
jgi:ABC-type bacteriocin/lantibiotic exporter with double-glycine peptidase domain